MESLGFAGVGTGGGRAGVSDQPRWANSTACLSHTNRTASSLYQRGTKSENRSGLMGNTAHRVPSAKHPTTEHGTVIVSFRHRHSPEETFPIGRSVSRSTFVGSYEKTRFSAGESRAEGRQFKVWHECSTRPRAASLSTTDSGLVEDRVRLVGLLPLSPQTTLVLDSPK